MNKSRLPPSSRAVAAWLLTGVFLLLVQIILGGITRLTGSGLSITEWNLVTGTFPPLNESQWLTEFGKYQQTPQYHLLNAGFNLTDFKFIFFWEWVHRLWARLIAVVFLVGLGWLLYRKKMKPAMVRPMIILFGLGALQGTVGWIMVLSGLRGDAIHVEPVKLALHFIFALGLISYTFWFALQSLIPPADIVADKNLRRHTWVIVVVLGVQLLYGALMAGHKAAAAAPSWPTINGDWIPASLFRESPLWLNFIDNKITVQFIHRGLAYLLLLLILLWTVKVERITAVGGRLYRCRWLPLLIVLVQAGLGISIVLSSTGIVANRWVGFDWLALMHELTGMTLLLILLYTLFLLRRVAAA